MIGSRRVLLGEEMHADDGTSLASVFQHAKNTTLRIPPARGGTVLKSARGNRWRAGSNVARVSNPTRLKAELQIPETQTRDLAIGQPAEIDTRNGIVRGIVSRIDPAAQGGTVGVDVTLQGELPAGARPDLSVDGTIQLEHLPDVIQVGAPAAGSEHSTISLFKLDGNGEAHRVQVKLGRRSVSLVEVVEGLQPGDQVILSDMSQYDSNDRVRINN